LILVFLLLNGRRYQRIDSANKGGFVPPYY